MSEILDHNSKEKTFSLLRPLPMIIEGLPIFICIVGVIASNEFLITLGFCTLVLVYTFLSWYLFKAKKFNPWDIIAGIILGNGLSVILLGVLFYIQNWEGLDLLAITSHTTLIVCLGIALIFTLVGLLHAGYVKWPFYKTYL